jgi:DNA-binding NarL/FixJ family response regulator
LTIIRKAEEKAMLEVLIVDDNALFRQTLKDILLSHHLSDLEIHVTEAENGDEAMKKIPLTPPDLIFMDIQLPGENGLSLTKKIKAEKLPIYIIMISDYDLSEYQEAAYESGCDVFLSKSSDLQEIISAVKSTLSNSPKL